MRHGPSRVPAIRRNRTGWLWLAAIFQVVGCDACGCGSDTLAELVTASGSVSRDFSATRGEWLDAELGDTFSLGDAVRTADGASARVSMASGGGIELVENTIVRFLSEAPGGGQSRLNVELGEASLTAGSSGIAVTGEFGTAEVAPGGQVRVNAEEGTLGLEVLIGSARIDQEGEQPFELGVGQRWTLDLELGTAVIEERDTPPEAPDASADAGAPDADTFPTGAVSVDVRGVVQIEDENGRWQRVGAGTAELPVGTRVRLQRRARLVLRRGADTVTVTGPGELTVGGPGDSVARLTRGRAQSAADEADLPVAVPGGFVIASAGGGRVDLGVRGGDAEVKATRGRAALRGTADSYTLRTGQTAVLRENGTIDARGRAPARAHIALPAGTSATLHDPSGPVAVKIRFADQCPEEGMVELSRGTMRSYGVGQANILVPVGRHAYQVRCSSNGNPSGGSVASGTLTVRRDSGRAPLPVRAQRNVVDADGRRYTVLYQNILPIVSVRWPDAPSTSNYSLVIRSRAGTSRRIDASSPQVTLESGDIPEGTHQLTFEAPGGSPPRSPTTTLTVGYDNAASAVYLREPGTGAISGGPVAVRGVALEGWTVSVGGTDLPLDRYFRFNGTASVPADVDAVAIRLVHPRHGVHYYLRRIDR